MSDPLIEQYEAYPYPARDPADEAKRLIEGSPSHLLEIDHYLFAEFAEPARQPRKRTLAHANFVRHQVHNLQHANPMLSIQQLQVLDPGV